MLPASWCRRPVGWCLEQYTSGRGPAERGNAATDLLVPGSERHLSRRWPFAATLRPPLIVLVNVGQQAAAVGAVLPARDERNATQAI